MPSLAMTQTRRKSLFSLFYFIPFALLIIMGSGITFLSGISTANSRWIVLFSLLILLIFRGRFFRYFDTSLFTILSLYFGWCILTSFWSEMPELSFIKSSMALIVAFTLIRTGIEWIKINPLVYALDYIWLMAFSSLLAGILGFYTTNDTVYNTLNNEIIY